MTPVALALAAEPAIGRPWRRLWDGCVREAYGTGIPSGAAAPGGRAMRWTRAKAHEDRSVAAPMAARPDAPDMPMGGATRTWVAYAADVVDPVKAWIEALRG